MTKNENTVGLSNLEENKLKILKSCVQSHVAMALGINKSEFIKLWVGLVFWLNGEVL